MNKIPYRTALITGASSGIGKTFAFKLAQQGLDLVLTARSEDKLAAMSAELTSKYGVKVSYHPADLSHPIAVSEIMRFLQQKEIHIDLLINNAGMGFWANFLDIPADSYSSNINLNVTSLVALTHSILPGMLLHGKGGVINIASGAALQPGPFMAVYAASKAFVLSFSEALFGEYEDKGIVVTAICPGNTPTEFQKAANANTKGMPETTTEQVVNESLEALSNRKNIRIVGTMNYIQSLAPRLLPRKTMIGIMKNLIGKRVNN